MILSQNLETLFHCVLTALPARILEPPCFLVYLDVIRPFLFWNPFIPGILSCSVFMTVGSGVVCVYLLCWASAKSILVRISVLLFVCLFLHLVHVYVYVPLLEVKYGYWIFYELIVYWVLGSVSFFVFFFSFVLQLWSGVYLSLCFLNILFLLLCFCLFAGVFTSPQLGCPVLTSWMLYFMKLSEDMNAIFQNENYTIHIHVHTHICIYIYIKTIISNQRI